MAFALVLTCAAAPFFGVRDVVVRGRARREIVSPKRPQSGILRDLPEVAAAAPSKRFKLENVSPMLRIRRGFAPSKKGAVTGADGVGDRILKAAHS